MALTHATLISWCACNKRGGGRRGHFQVSSERASEERAPISVGRSGQRRKVMCEILMATTMGRGAAPRFGDPTAMRLIHPEPRMR